VSTFDVIETHISWVILTGEYAYKIKKPMNFGFLDFTTLNKRAFYCQEELRLNQRLAPALYLEVLTITGDEHSPSFNGDGPIIDYAIKMKQFPQSALFNELQKHQQLTDDLLIELVEQLSSFHQHIAVANSNSPLGEPDTVFAPVAQNFEQILPLLTEKNDIAQLKNLQAWANDTFARLEPIFTQRKAHGFIRECHGDVHLGNVALYEGKALLFDCIEFNDEFRWIDTLSDIGFLIMDLEDKGLHEQASLCLNRYLECTGDYADVEILNFYKSYRAMVRAKVGLFRLGDPTLNNEQRANVLTQYRRYTTIAESYTEIPSRHLMIMHGLSGSGKSTVSKLLLKKLHAIRLRSDIERKRLFGLNELDKTTSPITEGIYTPEANINTYQQLLKQAKALLTAGYSVIIDAAFLKQAERALFNEMAENIGTPFLIISCEADVVELEKRIQTRLAENKDASEADTAVLTLQLTKQEPLNDDELPHAIIMDTEDPDLVDKTVTRLKRDFYPWIK
jgi:hypothetical protein